MDYVKIIFADVIMGYLLQSIGCILCIYAFNKMIVNFKMFSLVTIIYFIALFTIRNLFVNINFGVHTLLMMIVLILLGIGILKTPIYLTVFAILFSTAIILVCEVINGLFLNLILGSDKLDEIMGNSLSKAIAGIPANIIFVTIIFIIYFIKIKKVKKGLNSGKIGK